ncbi:MAG: DUF2203 domain-containing protein [SAR324 cluster bacterium]|nr:DUF2203 domain-containing protein [SAR324 cluster bacterium]
MNPKIFTFEEAQALIEEVREKTVFANERLVALRTQVESLQAGSKRAKKLNEWVNTVINQWAQEIMELGAQPKGLWTVDFDSGDGYYYCWALNEPNLAYFHLYEEGFAGRKPLSEIENGAPPLLLN